MLEVNELIMTFVVVVVVVVANDHSWKVSWGSYFDLFAGRLTLSLWLTQAKPATGFPRQQ